MEKLMKKLRLGARVTEIALTSKGQKLETKIPSPREIPKILESRTSQAGLETR